MNQELPGKTATKLDPRMLEALVCPRTQGTLEYDSDAQELISNSASWPFRSVKASQFYW